jgi:hypothetical protein
MVHVGLHSVGTYHKKFGWENKKIKMYFAECQLVDTRQRNLENPTSDLCWVLVRRHSAKTSLSSVRSRALGKEYFKLKKSLPSARSWALGKEVKYTNRRRRLVLLYLSHSLRRSLSLTHRTPPPPPSPIATSLSLTRSLTRRRLPLPKPPLPPRKRRRPPGKTSPARRRPSAPHVPGRAPRCRPTSACPHAPSTPPAAHRPPASVRTAAATRSPTRLPASQGDVNFSSFVSNCEWYL